MKIAILGTRGVPARYGGFETFAEELGARLVERGHELWVYARQGRIAQEKLSTREDGWPSYRGMIVRVIRAPRSKHLETVIHTFLCSLDVVRRNFDAVLVCNAANALCLPICRIGGARTLVNVDGLEWKRRKWRRMARRWHRVGARLTVAWAHEAIADARTVRDAYGTEFGGRLHYIPYGAPSDPGPGPESLARYGLRPREFVLCVSRWERENNPDLVVEAYRRVRTDYPLVMVGEAFYDKDLGARVRDLASGDHRIMLLGAVYGGTYRALQSNAACYIQASEIGGTHPALLEGMAWGGCVLANDIPDHREVAGETARYYRYNDAVDLADQLQAILDNERGTPEMRSAARQRMAERYDWDSVTRDYERLAAGPIRPRLGSEPLPCRR